MRRACCALSLLLIGSAPLNAAVENTRVSSPWSLTAQTGVAIGQIERPVDKEDGTDTDEKEVQKVTIGGVPLNVLMQKDISAAFTAHGVGGLLIDIPNTQIARQHFGGGLYWHLFGGARKIVEGDAEKGFILEATNPWQLSLVGQGALMRYSASTKDGSTSLVGSVFEVRSGFRFRYDVSLLEAGGFELLATLFSLPASQERLSARSTELGFFWRW